VSPSLRLGRYIAEGLLGPGGVSETYLARLAEGPEAARNQLFALKLLREDRISERAYPEVARRFVAAGEQLHDFRRPGFGKVVDFCGEGGTTFIVTEYVAGLDLTRLAAIFQAETVGRACVDPVLAGLLGAEIARLLHVGHTAKPSFPHLGLAPQNVTVTEPGEVVLLDAGISAPIRSITEQPAERWWFVAPELASVDVGATALGERQGVAADLYSLGALLYFLITGHPARSETETSERPAPSELPALTGVSTQMAAAVRRLLATDPEDRPESAAVLVDWLSGGVDSARERQRLIGEAMRAAEEEARRAAVERARRNLPPSITLPLTDDAGNRHSRGKAQSGRWLVWALASLGVVVLLAGALFLIWPAMVLSGGGAGLGGVSSAVPESGGDETTAGKPPPPRLASDRDEAVPTRERILSHLAGHLVAETLPPGATVWVDGVAKGTTFADIIVGPGTHRVVLTLPGYRTFRDTFDTSRGVIIRRTLAEVPLPARSGGFVRVECGTVGKFPILIDDEETGHLCPTLQVPTAIGKHMVGIYLPGEKRVVSVGVTVEPGGRAAMAKFSE
jgi:hypothetical protein